MERRLNSPDQETRRQGFSLIELLVVVAIIAILAGLTIPALTSTQNALQITRAAQGLADNLNLARQSALSRNRNVSLRLLGEPNANVFHSYQMSVIEDDGSEKPGRLMRLPQGVVISGNPQHSAGLVVAGTTNMPGGKVQQFAEIQFRRDGSADFGNSAEWLVTILRENDASSPQPANFVALLVEPSSGATRIFRP